MQGLFITQKWSSIFGFDDDDVRSINYMATKNFILAMKDTKEYYQSLGIDNYQENCKTEDIIKLYNEMNNNKYQYDIKIIVGKYYYYKERIFCRKNNSFENFISKVKKYYANKIKHYKSIKSLSYRRIHGKYPRFI